MFDIVPGPVPPGVDLHRLIREHSCNCVESTLLLVLIGKLFGLSVSAVYLPNHTFARAQLSDCTVNIDPLTTRSLPNDGDFRRVFAVTDRQVARHICLSTLSDREFLGMIAHKCAHEHIVSGRPLSRHVRRLSRISIEYSARYPDIYNALAINYYRRGAFQYALKAVQKGLDIDADSAPLISNRIAILLELGQYDNAYSEALAREGAAISGVCDSVELRINLVRAACRVGQYGRAKRLLADHSVSRMGSALSADSPAAALYLACIQYWTGEYHDSFCTSMSLASSVPVQEMYIVWAISALWRQADDRGIKKVLKKKVISDRYVRAVSQLFVTDEDDIDEATEKLSRDFPQKRGETASYLGEYWIRFKAERALVAWQMCIRTAANSTLEHLRAYRNLLDAKAPI
jgi:tetratricopeptide (TPR) repeat protein